MAGEFSNCVGIGLHLTQRLYYGKGVVSSPLVPPTMEKTPESYFPTAPMVYAVIPEPEVVDNPDVPSYQPYVYGRCDPPALIPLHMLGIAMEIDCNVDTAFITLTGKWRVHCIMASKKCNCRIALPIGKQDSLLGVEVEVSGKSYQSQLITAEKAKNLEKVIKVEHGRFLNYQIYTFKVAQASGGSVLSIKVSWSQKLSYRNGEFCLSIPFSFPAYVNPVGKKILKRERIQLNVNFGIDREIAYRSTSHSLKELSRQPGRLGLLYEAEGSMWSNSDFNFSYTASSNDIFGSLLLQSPSLCDFDQREMFCLYLFPQSDQTRKVFKKEVVFLIDISGSMRGKPLEKATNALLESLSKLSTEDHFNIIAFNEEFYLFSSSMELATKGAITNAAQWVKHNFIASGGSNIFLPLKQAMKLLSDPRDSMPLIFLITDGSVEDERDICNFVKDHPSIGGVLSPRIYTLGIGLHCNHYFLRMLAQIGRGHYDAAYDADSIDSQMQRLFAVASSLSFASLTIDAGGSLDSLELFPAQIPDLSSESPLIVSGRYEGSVSSAICISCTLADMSTVTFELKAQKAKDLPLDRLLAMRQIDVLTASAWISQSLELKEKIAKISIMTGFPSEYTCIILFPTDKGIQFSPIHEISSRGNQRTKVLIDGQKMAILGSHRIGFGNLSATVDNIPPGTEQLKPSQSMLVRAASTCFGRLADNLCCMCFLSTCSHVNDQCAIIFAQICTALACFHWIECCFETCETCDTCDLCSCLL